eukprot:2915211-Rhodomonas_salina.1
MIQCVGSDTTVPSTLYARCKCCLACSSLLCRRLHLRLLSCWQHRKGRSKEVESRIAYTAQILLNSLSFTITDTHLLRGDMFSNLSQACVIRRLTGCENDINHITFRSIILALVALLVAPCSSANTGSPAAFHSLFEKSLLDYGFTPIGGDRVTFQYRKGTSTLILSIHVDDGIAACNDAALYKRFLSDLAKQFELSDQ